MITTETFTAQSGGGHIVDMATKGAFNPARHAGAETLPVNPEIPAITAIRYIGGYAYLYFPVPEPGPLGTNGLHWLKATADAPSGNFVDNLPTDAVEGLVTPAHLLAELRSLTTLHLAGRAHGPGWTGTRYTFTANDVELDSVPQAVIHGSVTVDRHGRVRQLLLPAAAPGILRVGNRHQDPHDQPDLQRLRGPRTGPGTASQPGLQPRARHGLHSPLRSPGTTPGITSPGSGPRYDSASTSQDESARGGIGDQCRGRSSNRGTASGMRFVVAAPGGPMCVTGEAVWAASRRIAAGEVGDARCGPCLGRRGGLGGPHRVGREAGRAGPASGSP